MKNEYLPTDKLRKCMDCVRYTWNARTEQYECSSLYGPDCIEYGRDACKMYWDREEQERRNREELERRELERLEAWAKNKDNPPMPAKWERDVNEITGELMGAMPFCPNCDEPLYETDRCYFCGQAIEQDEQMGVWNAPPEIKRMDCFFCGAEGGVEYVESPYNGHKSGHCLKCGAMFIE